MVKGHIGTALIEITDTVLKFVIEKSGRVEPSEVPLQAIIDLAIMSTENDGNLKLYWVSLMHMYSMYVFGQPYVFGMYWVSLMCKACIGTA